jgi:hypothetical protein
MATPVYRMFTVKPLEPWYRLSQEERTNLLARVSATLEEVGGKTVVLCDSAWASEEWAFFGVEQYPDVEALQQHEALLQKLNWPLYIEAHTIVGVDSRRSG